MTKKRLFPFGWLPSHWGLKGKTREVARAEYEKTGEDLERELALINLAGLTETEIEIKLVEIEYKYGQLDEEAKERKILAIRKEDMDKDAFDLARLELDYKYKKIGEEEYRKNKSTILDEPYVNIPKIELDPKNPAFGGVVLDWNDAFVRLLEKHGYGPNPEPDTTVEQWFNDVCRNVALDAFDGVGDINERLGTPMRRGADNDVITKEQFERMQSRTRNEDED